MKYPSRLLLFLTCASVLLSCRKGEPCDGVSCTEELRTFSVRLVKADGTAPVLDSVQTSDAAGVPLRSLNGRAVYGLTGPLQGGGVFAAVLDDMWVAGNENRKMDVTFRGFRGGRVLFEQGYTISADCCHIIEPDGPNVITVQD